MERDKDEPERDFGDDDRVFANDALEKQFRERCVLVGWEPGPNADRETWAEWLYEVSMIELYEPDFGDE